MTVLHKDQPIPSSPPTNIIYCLVGSRSGNLISCHSLIFLCFWYVGNVLQLWMLLSCSLQSRSNFSTFFSFEQKLFSTSFSLNLKAVVLVWYLVQKRKKRKHYWNRLNQWIKETEWVPNCFDRSDSLGDPMNSVKNLFKLVPQPRIRQWLPY